MAPLRFRLAGESPRALAWLEDAQAFACEGATVAEMIDGAAVFELLDDGGQVVGAVALEVVGQVLRCTALGARPGAHAVSQVIEWARALARVAGCVSMQADTRREGLARLLRGLGWREINKQGQAVTLACEV